MKFRDLEKGTLAGRVEDFDVRGSVLKIRVVPLLVGRDVEIQRGAAAYVEAENKAHPGTVASEAKAGDPTYERGIYAHTILRATFDPEDGKPFFASIEEMLDPTDGLDRDRLAWLFELQQQVQSDYAPRGSGKLTPGQFFEWLDKTAEVEDGLDLPFERSPRATQRAFVRGIAKAYRDSIPQTVAMVREIAALRARLETASPPDKSTPGPSSPDTTTSSAVSAPSASAASEESSG